MARRLPDPLWSKENGPEASAFTRDLLESANSGIYWITTQ